MDIPYELACVRRVLKKYREREHRHEMTAMSGQMGYMSETERRSKENEYRDDMVILTALEFYKNSLEGTSA